MAEYGNFCPVSMAAEVVADRWTPLILRELVLGNTRFNDIARAMPGISRSLLVQRLRHLERRGVLDTRPSPTGRGREYHLTPAGRDLEPLIDGLGRWAVEWLFDEMRPREVSATTLMWWLHRRIATDRLPSARVTLEFQHTAPEAVTVWLVLDRGEVSVCMQHPGFDVDVIVTAETGDLAEVYQGYTTWREAVAAEKVSVHGPPRLTDALPTWFLWSPWAEVTRQRAQLARRGEGAANGGTGEQPGPLAATAAAAAAVAAVATAALAGKADDAEAGAAAD